MLALSRAVPPFPPRAWRWSRAQDPAPDPPRRASAASARPPAARAPRADGRNRRESCLSNPICRGAREAVRAWSFPIDFLSRLWRAVATAIHREVILVGKGG